LSWSSESFNKPFIQSVYKIYSHFLPLRWGKCRMVQLSLVGAFCLLPRETDGQTMLSMLMGLFLYPWIISTCWEYSGEWFYK
jgi:hypothetical protein